jgi:hypothetical protein
VAIRKGAATDASVIIILGGGNPREGRANPDDGSTSLPPAGPSAPTNRPPFIGKPSKGGSTAGSEGGTSGGGGGSDGDSDKGTSTGGSDEGGSSEGGDEGGAAGTEKFVISVALLSDRTPTMFYLLRSDSLAGGETTCLGIGTTEPAPSTLI